MNEKDDSKQYQWKCTQCGFIYDKCDIPREYKCPVCGSPMPKFERQEREALSN